MKALQIDAYGGPEAIVLRDIAVPRPGPGEVLIRLAYSGVNFMDVYTRMGRYAGSAAKSGHYQSGLPLTLGIEGAGRIEALGADVRGWAVGDRVAYALARGSNAEYATVPARQIARVPDAVGLDIAAAVMFQGLTADYLVHDVGRLDVNRSCLVHSGAGGIGQLLIQMAKALGVRIVATASSEKKRLTATVRGADVVVDYADDAFVDACKRLTAGAGVDVVFDSVGKTAFDGNLRALRKSGLFVHYGANSGPIGPIDPMRLADSGSLWFTRPRLADHVADGDAVARRADRFFSAIVAGTLVVDIERTCGFPGVAELHTLLEGRRAVGKSILAIDPSIG